jgi:hypothetical protein
MHLRWAYAFVVFGSIGVNFAQAQTASISYSRPDESTRPQLRGLSPALKGLSTLPTTTPAKRTRQWTSSIAPTQMP